MSANYFSLPMSFFRMAYCVVSDDLAAHFAVVP